MYRIKPARIMPSTDYLIPSGSHKRFIYALIEPGSTAIFSSISNIMRHGFHRLGIIRFLGLFLGLIITACEAGAAPENEAGPPAKMTRQIEGQPADSVKQARLSAWSPIFRGVERLQASADQPRPLKVQAVRVDLRETGIDFLVTPSNGAAPKDVGARSVSEFLEEFQCQVAINGSVFDVYAEHRGNPMDVLGLSLSRGQRYSPPNRWDALLIGKDRRAWIARSPVNARAAWNGMSGYYALLADGRNKGGMADLHPRSAVGVSRDGRYLLLMAADGRQPGYSEGLTTAETAEWMRKLGAWNALNLDGGGSTALVMRGSDGQPTTLNRPSGPPPGTERRVANHLCVYAKGLAGRR